LISLRYGFDRLLAGRHLKETVCGEEIIHERRRITALFDMIGNFQGP
jgi:hypothetical protein